MSEWKDRRVSEAKKMIKFFDLTSATDTNGKGPMAISKKFFSPPLGKASIGEAFRACGCEVFVSVGEADKDAARICHARKCLGVISCDSDFIAFRVPLLISEASVRFSKGRIFAKCYKLNKVASLLGMKPEFFPL